MIRELKKEEYSKARDLIMDTYNHTEAKNDTVSGRMKFYEEFVKGDELDRMILNKELHIYGYYDDELMGIISCMSDGYIMHLFVGISYMGRGIASSLLNFIFDLCKTKGLSYVRLDSSVYARGFYKKMGFIETDDKIIEDGMSYIPMKRYL